MSNGFFSVPYPKNEPVLEYAPGSPERQTLKTELKRQSEMLVDIPIIIGGKEIRTAAKKKVVMPHDHSHILANFYHAGKEEIKQACQEALKAKASWAAMPFEHRAAIFLKAAELISTKYRALINAATMLGQGKTVFQAEIDAACELSDFLRFNVHFAQEIYKGQPENSKGIWNRCDYRPLDGFVAAITPFNFTAIGANLCSSPALMGNTVIWKPSDNAVLSNYYVMKVFMEAGLPAGVINFVPCSGDDAGKYILTNPDLGGVHFTGSTAVFNTIWQTIGKNIGKYRSYPRIVGETGGKDFVFAHSSADIDALVTALVRGAYEYQGQKCSAASRAYIPSSIYPQVIEKLLCEISKIKVGDVRDFTNFMGAVINQKAFDKIKSYIDYARESDEAKILCGGYDDSKGYFVQPTVIVTNNPNFRTMKEEIFGPVLTIYEYQDKDFDKTLKLCDTTTAYALTGAIYARDREAIAYMENALRFSAGNLYINDKCTGAVVGQQPFGGSRASGTNDKAGSILNLYRWVSSRTIKEVFNPPVSFEYPFMQEE